MHKRVTIYLSYFAVAGLFGLICIREIFAWNENTHKILSEFAAKSSVLDISNGDYMKRLGYSYGIDENFLLYNKYQSLSKWIQDGAFFEDAGSDAQGIAGTARYINHFHNPLRPWSTAGLDDWFVFHYTGESSLIWSQDADKQSAWLGGDWSWKATRNFFYNALTCSADSERQANFAQMFEGLGHQLHLLQDSGQPDHVRNDAHPADGGGLVMGLETWSKTKFATVAALKDFFQQFALTPQMPTISTNPSSYTLDSSYYTKNLAPSALFIDTDQYNGTAPSMSLSQGLAEYTNANFVSDDTIFTETLSPDDRHYFPYPRKTSTNIQELQNQTLLPETIIAEDGVAEPSFYIKKNADGEMIDHFVKPRYFTNNVYSVVGGGGYLYNRTFYRDEKCHEDYAQKLIPRAVGYSAGLLNYFFRGKIDMTSDPDNPGKYVIQNLSNENMSGTFELYYDDINDNRVKVTGPGWNLTVNAGSQSIPLEFTTPISPEPKEKGKYVFVFKGAMGSETGAVAAKMVQLAGNVNARMLIVTRYGNPNYIRVITQEQQLSLDFPWLQFGIPFAARFDINNPSQFVVMTLQAGPQGTIDGIWKFHKFAVKESEQQITYLGVVLTIPLASRRDFSAVETCSNATWSPTCSGKMIVSKEYDSTFEYNTVRMSDFLFKDGLITPFGVFADITSKGVFYSSLDWNASCTDTIEHTFGGGDYYRKKTTGIYYRDRILSETVTNSYTHDKCDGIRYWTFDVLDFWPLAIFNERDFVYNRNSRTMTNLPISVPGIGVEELVQTMIRKTGKYSFFTKDEGYYFKSLKSYSSEIGVADCPGLLIGDNQLGFEVGEYSTWVVRFRSCSDKDYLYELGGSHLRKYDICDFSIK